MTRLPTVHSAAELIALVQELGILPAFQNHIPGFSAEDCIAPAYWFPAEGEGFWEWKGPVIQGSGCAYGKFFSGRAGFMTPDWYREFANYRRDGYDFDSRYEEGLARHRDKLIFDVLWEEGSLLSKQLSRRVSSEDRRDFSAVMTRLQMQGYVVISNFEYELRKDGTPYGWGVTRYETPEHRFGAAFTDRVYAREPAESKALLFEHLRSLLPDVADKAILKLIG